MWKMGQTLHVPLLSFPCLKISSSALCLSKDRRHLRRISVEGKEDIYDSDGI